MKLPSDLISKQGLARTLALRSSKWLRFFGRPPRLPNSSKQGVAHLSPQKNTTVPPELSVQVEHLYKYYGDFCALSDLSFQVPRGEVLGLLGANGAGKTSCLRILSSYMMPSSGRCLIQGRDIFREALEAKKHIGYLPESTALYSELNVSQYLLFIARMRSSTKQSFQKEWEQLEERCAFNLLAHAHTPIAQLSLGYRKRLGILQALIATPSVLILDEPTSGLDPLQTVEMRQLIRSLAGDYTIIISSHILTEISRTCDRVLMIYNGCLAQELEAPDYSPDMGADPSALEKAFIKANTHASQITPNHLRR